MLIVDTREKWTQKERPKPGSPGDWFLRHEIVHAFLFESGLAESSFSTDAWAKNEEMIDWIAFTGPKIVAAWQKAGCME